MNFLATRRAGFLACFFLLVLASCGCGGGGGEDGDDSLVAVFTPACPIGDSCYEGSVTMQPGGTSGAVFEVQVVLNRLDTVIVAADMLIGFDPAVVQYQGYTKGPALGDGDGTTYLVTPAAGEVIVSIGVPAGVSVSSASVMITLAFKALKAGQTNLTFLDKDVSDGTALYCPPLKSIILLGDGGWSGGLATAD